MDGTPLQALIEEQHPECLLMSSSKIPKVMRKTRRNKGRKAEFHVNDISSATEQPTEFDT
jgi:hypothetical protein